MSEEQKNQQQRHQHACDQRKALADGLCGGGPGFADFDDDETGEFRYSKGLKDHDTKTGLPKPASYKALKETLDRIRRNVTVNGGRAQYMANGNDPVSDFNSGMNGFLGYRPLVNPLAGVSFDTEGPDPHEHPLLPPPTLNGEQFWEMRELYWMALLRDVPFAAWADHKLVTRAADDLDGAPGKPAEALSAKTIDPATLFRGMAPGDAAGPYLSQFLLQTVRFGTFEYEQRQHTAPPGIDHLTEWGAWLAVQDGAPVDPGRDALDTSGTYIRNLRDLATYVHFDQLHQAYFNAGLILIEGGYPLDSGNPYKGNPHQDGFGTFGGPALLVLLSEVATRALKAVWFNKWFVHRRMRPEEFGGRIEAGRTAADFGQAVELVRARTGTALLPMAFPEGSPTHPAYGAGHATVAGACVTILKAWFDTGCEMRNPVVASPDGRSLLPYLGGESLKVGGELNKLAANISLGRNAAGVHWRSDYTESIRLGELVALEILRQHTATFAETGASFTVPLFRGGQAVVANGTVTPPQP